MTALRTPVRQVPPTEPWYARPGIVALLAVLLCVSVTLARGQDVSWDLQNYHRYAPWAWFQDRLAIDFIPVGLQSYFNPALDLPIHLLQERINPRVIGVLLGTWHSLVLYFVWLIGRELLPNWSPLNRWALVLAGILAPAFWAGLGMQLGDVSTAVCVLAAVWAAMRWLRVEEVASRAFWVWGGVTGALLGAAVALKPTQACPAVALGVAFVLADWRGPRRASAAIAALLMSSAVTFALFGGWWFLAVWRQFGNPLFPQFGNWFPSPLAAAAGMADRRFLPEGLLAFVFRPLQMAWNYRIASELPMRAWVWPFWFIAGAWYLTRLMRGAAGYGGGPSRRTRPQRLLLWYVLLAVMLWTGMFGIHRYTVAFETLMPLAVAVLWPADPQTPRPEDRWMPIAAGLVAVAVCLTEGGSQDWGHTAWNRRAFTAETPFRADGDRPLVLIGGHPLGWLIPFLPTRASYLGIATNVAPGPGTRAEIDKRLARSDRIYVLLDDSDRPTVEAAERAVRELGFELRTDRCSSEAASIGRQRHALRLCGLR